MIPIDTARERFNHERVINEYAERIETLIDNKILTASAKGETIIHIDVDDVDTKMTSPQLQLFGIALQQVFDKYEAGGYETDSTYVCNGVYAGGFVSWKKEEV